ncbi:MAG TPA: LysR substrate-binding domain-containing protein [Caulobacteraceae bacterium]|nr:LysR substrate-binding domain-containing protein [Caulobacteraceae bacterium]
MRLRGADGAIVPFWAEQKGRSVRHATEGRLVVSDIGLVLRAAAEGIGIALVGDRSAEPYLGDGRLVRVLDSWSPQFEALALYYPQNRHVSPALRAFIDMVRAGAH